MYAKLFTSILDSSIADSRRLRHFFTDMLLCADASGIVLMTPAALARRIGADLAEVEWGLAELQKPDPQSKTPDHEGRRIEALAGHGFGWQILNYKTYRSLKDGDQQREATRLRVERFRAKRKPVTPSNVTVTDATPLQKKRQKQKQIKSPPTPKGESGASLETAKAGTDHQKQVPSSPRALRVAAIMHRKPETPWTPAEIAAFKAKGAAVAPEVDLVAIEQYYSVNWPPDREKNILRHDLQTLLNNWPGELGRAEVRNQPKQQPPARHWEEES